MPPRSHSSRVRSIPASAAEAGSKRSAGSTHATSAPRPVERAQSACASPVRPDDAGPWISDSAPRGRPPAISPSSAATPNASGCSRRSSPRSGGASACSRRVAQQLFQRVLEGRRTFRFSFAIILQRSSACQGPLRAIQSRPWRSIRTSSAYYALGGEQGRLDQGYFPLERARTQEIVLRHLPPSPAVVLDVGGAAGAYALWLAARGYEVHLVDPVPLHVEQAMRASAPSEHALASASVGDARALTREDAKRRRGPAARPAVPPGRARRTACARCARSDACCGRAASSSPRPSRDSRRSSTTWPTWAGSVPGCRR